MNIKYKYLIKNTTILTISNFSSKLLSFFLVPLYTGVLTTTEYGIYDLIVSSVSLLLPILTLNITEAVMRFLMDKQISKIDVASIGLRYVIIGCFLFTAIVVIIQKFHLISQINGLELYIILYMISITLGQFFMQLAKGLEHILDMGIAGILSTIISLSLNIYLLIYIKMGFKGFFIASIVTQFLQILYYFIRLKAWQLFKLNKRTKLLPKEMVCYSAPLIFTMIGWWANSAADKYIITLYCGVSANGLLAIAYKIPVILQTLKNIFIQAWQISAIKEIKNGNEFYEKMFVFFNMLTTISSSIIILLTKPLASFLFAKDFYSAWQYIPYLLIGSVFNGAAGFLGPIFSANKNSRILAKSAIYATIINIILNFILAYYFKIQGAIIATAISAYVMFYIRIKGIKDMFNSNIYIITYISWLLLITQATIEIYIDNYILEIIILLLLLILHKNQLSMLLIKTKEHILNYMKGNTINVDRNIKQN